MTARAVYDRIDPLDPKLVTPAQFLDGVWLGITTKTQADSDALKALPNDACRLILDPAAAAAGQNYIVYISPAVDQTTLATMWFEPVFAGRRYNIPA